MSTPPNQNCYICCRTSFVLVTIVNFHYFFHADLSRGVKLQHLPIIIATCVVGFLFMRRLIVALRSIMGPTLVFRKDVVTACSHGRHREPRIPLGPGGGSSTTMVRLRRVGP